LVINQVNTELATGGTNLTDKTLIGAYPHFRTACLLIATNHALRQP
jgi:hypothetical protein